MQDHEIGSRLRPHVRIGPGEEVIALPDLHRRAAAVQQLGRQRLTDTVARVAVIPANLHWIDAIQTFPIPRQGGIPTLHLEHRLRLWQSPHHLAQTEPRLRSHPELIGIGMDHPISAEGGRPLGHPRDPLRLGIGLRRLLDHLHKPPFGVGLQDVWGGIHRPVVGDDELIHALGQVMLKVEGQDVGLIPHQQGHDQLHRSPASGMDGAIQRRVTGESAPRY